MPGIPGNKLELGIVDGKGVPLEMTPEMRSTHLWHIGRIDSIRVQSLHSPEKFSPLIERWVACR